MKNDISILDIIEDTTVDGPGFRTTVYAAGCVHQCAGCHNPQSWDIAKGVWVSIDSVLERVKDAELSNVTFSGGDPFVQPEAFTELARRIKSETKKTIWCYTGYLYETILKSPRLVPMLSYIDVLVDGRYMAELRDESLLFRGSRNQRLIDVQLSLKKGEVVLWTPEDISFRRSVIPQAQVHNHISL